MCYHIAYFALPQLIFADSRRFTGYFSGESCFAGAYLFALGASFWGIEPKAEKDDVLKFETHCGELSNSQRRYVLQYPEPAPFDMNAANRILAPHFSIVLQNPTNDKVRYYVLGQRPMGGTTLRTVLPDGTNANLGKGCPSDIESLLDFRKQNPPKDFFVAAITPLR